MEPLRIEQSDDAGWTVLTLVGVVDVATAPQLRQALIEAQQGDVRFVALDLDGVEFLDSFGLGVIVGGLKRAAAQDGEVAVICSRSRLTQLFRITRLNEILRLAASVADLGRPAGPLEGLH
jgi:anti-sigma B factor antagonist